MSRQARQLSQSGLYHIVFRGVNRQHIFEEDTDYQKMIDTLVKIGGRMGTYIFRQLFLDK